MKSIRHHPVPGPQPGRAAEHRACGDVIAYGAVRVAPEAIPALRHKPGPVPGTPLPASFLKHADEQSVVGLAAVLAAIEQHGLAGTNFRHWAVLAAPRFIGRVALAAAIQRYATEGAWGISPHLIPHRSLHAVSGTVSQALKIHGSNFGVGGGPSGAAEVVLTGLAMLGATPPPGVWVVMTGWHPEPIPDRDGKTSTPAVCGAVALALTAPRCDWAGPRLRLTLPREVTPDAVGSFSLETLLDTLAAPLPGLLSAGWRLDNGGYLYLEGSEGRCALPAPHFFRKWNGAPEQVEWSEAGPGKKS